MKIAPTLPLKFLTLHIGMCGDGANDCGALKEASVGISLSNAEASIAAPFTSCQQDIKCVVSLVSEGRASLVTAFSIFKFSALCSLLQFSSILILYWFDTNLSDVQFLYVDMLLVLPLDFLMGKTGPCKGRLSSRHPCTSLVEPHNLISLFVQVVIQIGFQIGSLLWSKQLPW